MIRFRIGLLACFLATLLWPFFKILANSRNNSEINSRTRYLEKRGELKYAFSNMREAHFINVSDICCDRDRNVYIADSGLDKIFKYSPEGRFLTSFGEQGQAPGQFLTAPGKSTLKISSGNDKYIYIYDSGNQRITVFDNEGTYIKKYSLPSLINDIPEVDSTGQIFLAFNDGVNAIHRFDNNLKHKADFFDINLHFESDFFKALRSSRGYINGSSLKKLITKYDRLIILSNYSFYVYIFSSNGSLINKFKINQNNFLIDFKKRIKNIAKEGYFILPFDIALDGEENLYLIYFNSSISNWELYKYKISGVFQEIIRFPEKVNAPITVDPSGYFYASLGGKIVNKYNKNY